MTLGERTWVESELKQLRCATAALAAYPSGRCLREDVNTASPLACVHVARGEAGVNVP